MCRYIRLRSVSKGFCKEIRVRVTMDQDKNIKESVCNMWKSCLLVGFIVVMRFRRIGREYARQEASQSKDSCPIVGWSEIEVQNFLAFHHLSQWKWRVLACLSISPGNFKVLWGGSHLHQGDYITDTSAHKTKLCTYTKAERNKLVC